MKLDKQKIWLQENSKSIESSNKFVEKNDLPLADPHHQFWTPS
ncbi:TPA: type II toxin-antitoxin system CcdA family antitoxin [Vibrio parahaemolyticus]|nr:type II toxin-antitoxin system CcdA family antitoxin [Vibrio parahaemolyticus]HBC3383580.1 type II toxin-antitoxin system CcdA family antitoxin [Vibrio parahaemolyticus]HBC3445570.1 type II toxin-antitoxin system CcdA family antitoxin [Vibrio parahaemolyticus]HBC3845388.1 type II toxin-antitoxin system CcdA family antitoxin [Vibrio parahaemolyticus]HBH7861967.1 type II toxin-antitoxin system CcdA family antitoxin [Vibrio parahaemolyticus]